MKNEQSLDRSAMQATKAKKFPVCLRIPVPVLSRNTILVPGFTVKGGKGNNRFEAENKSIVISLTRTKQTPRSIR